VPTLLVADEHDHGGGPVPAMQAMAAQCPAATLRVIAGVGHICNHEAPPRSSACSTTSCGPDPAPASTAGSVFPNDTGDADARLLLEAASFYQTQRIDLRLNTRVSALDPQHRSVHLPTA